MVEFESWLSGIALHRDVLNGTLRRLRRRAYSRVLRIAAGGVCGLGKALYNYVRFSQTLVNGVNFAGKVYAAVSRAAGVQGVVDNCA